MNLSNINNPINRWILFIVFKCLLFVLIVWAFRSKLKWIKKKCIKNIIKVSFVHICNLKLKSLQSNKVIKMLVKFVLWI